MGFDVRVESMLGVGSTFSLVLTGVTESPGSVLAAMADGPVLIGDETVMAARDHFVVLVVDDETDAREILSKSFADLGCTVVTATNADEGLRLARRLRPDLITLDVMMPRKNGLEALRELKSDALLCAIPVVVVSVVAREHRDHLVGAASYLDKPVTREDLATVMYQNMTDRQRAHLALLDPDDSLTSVA
jgi:CheY-like chemotaxis protein